jgi:hypothetical protein
MPDVGGPISGVGDDLATDPPVSESQRRAMFAAREGRSTLGIPKEVGEHFVGKADDQTTGTFLDSLRTFLRGLLAWAGEEGSEEEHAEPPATDREDAANLLKPALTRELNAANDAAMALDKNSVRSKDADGRLHIDQANISKAVVNPYKGSEIPNAAELGLDPEKTYRLLRHPDELAKAAKSFNNIPILSEHQPVSADEHPAELVIGSTGNDARFEPPYLKNSLTIWPQSAIDAIESGEKRELSCGYRYTPVMQPGVYEGQSYDGIMTALVGNHVACVPEGRAGSDVVIGDSKPPITKEETTMLTSVPAILAGFKTALKAKPKFAMDADIDEILPLLQTVLGQNPDNGNGGDQPPMPAPAPIDAPPPDIGTLPSSAVPMGNQDNEMIRDIRARDAARRLGRDETDEERQKREDEDKAADEAFAAKDRAIVEPIDAAKDQEAKKPQPDLVTKSAMDAALKAMQSTMARTQREIREAERAVFPYVGELTMSFDSKDQVYATALSMRGIDPKPIHPSAYPALLAAQPKAGTPTHVPHVAMDAASAKGFLDRFPETKHIRQI